MKFSIRHWGVGRLVGAWAVYWVALAGVTLAPFIRIVWTLMRLPGEHGTVSLTAGDAGVALGAMKDGVTVWSGIAPLWEVALWTAVPPLVLWGAWLALRPTRHDADSVSASTAYDALPDAARNGWQQPITPSSTPLRVERRHEQGG